MHIIELRKPSKYIKLKAAKGMLLLYCAIYASLQIYAWLWVIYIPQPSVNVTTINLLYVYMSLTVRR